MKLTILKIEKPVFTGDFESVILPTTEGEVEIFPDHAPFMAGLKKGKITIKANGEKQVFDIEKGFVEVNKLEVLVIL